MVGTPLSPAACWPGCCAAQLGEPVCRRPAHPRRLPSQTHVAETPSERAHPGLAVCSMMGGLQKAHPRTRLSSVVLTVCARRDTDDRLSLNALWSFTTCQLGGVNGERRPFSSSCPSVDPAPSGRPRTRGAYRARNRAARSLPMRLARSLLPSVQPSVKADWLDGLLSGRTSTGNTPAALWLVMARRRLRSR